MRYRVVFGRQNASEAKAEESPIKRPESEKSTKNMIIREDHDNFVERKNALNKVVNAEASEKREEKDDKKILQYQLPMKIRVPVSLKVSPGISVPEPILEAVKLKHENSNKTSNNSDKIQQDVIKTDLAAKDSKRHVTSQESVADLSKPAKGASGNKASSQNEDKEFEIPLEESLKAVEDFIKREKELSKWKVGEDVLAKWIGNGLYYKAKIMEIFPSGIVVIEFDSYEIIEEVDYKDLCKFVKKTTHYKKKGQRENKTEKDKEEEKKTSICAKLPIKDKKRKKRGSLRKNPLVSMYKSDIVTKKKILPADKYSNLSMDKKKAQDVSVVS